MIVKYKEELLQHDFCTPEIGKIIDAITHAHCLNLISLPGIGITVLLKFLMTHYLGPNYIYVDCDHLAEVNLEEFYSLFLKQSGVEIPDQVTRKEFVAKIEKKIGQMLEEDREIVIILNHFDLLEDYFTQELFDLFKFIRGLNSRKVVLIFNSKTPLVEILGDTLTTINHNLLNRQVYLKRYELKDLKDIAEKILALDLADPVVQKALELSGGGYHLFVLLSRTQKIENPLLDIFIQFHFKKLLESVTRKRRMVLERIALGKEVTEIEPFLIESGLVILEQGSYRLFTPLFSDYLRSHTALSLSHGEMRLFRLLKSKLNKVVSKDEIFNEVWGEDMDSGSDWALNSMIYRIRNNPVFKNQGYELENFKKVGYRLVKD